MVVMITIILMTATKYGDEDLIVSHVGWLPRVGFDRLAQVEDRVAGHVQQDLRMIPMMKMVPISTSYNGDEDRYDDSDNGVDQCDAFDDEEHHLVGLDQQFGVIDHGQA